MMELEEERRTAVGKTVEEPRFPERSRAIERRLVRGRDLAEELVEVARRRERVVAEVVVDVERGIGSPVGQGEVQRRFHHVLAEPRHCGDGALEGLAEPSRVGRAVEDEQHRHRGRLHRRVGPPEREILAREAQGRVGAHACTRAWSRRSGRLEQLQKCSSEAAEVNRRGASSPRFSRLSGQRTTIAEERRRAAAAMSSNARQAARETIDGMSVTTVCTPDVLRGGEGARRVPELARAMAPRPFRLGGRMEKDVAAIRSQALERVPNRFAELARRCVSDGAGRPL